MNATKNAISGKKSNSSCMRRVLSWAHGHLNALSCRPQSGPRMDRCESVLQSPPDQSAAAAAEPRGRRSCATAGSSCIRRTRATRSAGIIGDKAALERVRQTARHRARSRFHARVSRPVGHRDLCARRELGLPPAAKLADAGSVHVRAARDARSCRSACKIPRSRSIGIRVPDHTIAQALLGALGEPLMSSTLLLPNDSLPLTEPEDIRDRARASSRRDHRRRRLRHRADVGARLERRRGRGRAQRQGRRFRVRRLTAPLEVRIMPRCSEWTPRAAVLDSAIRRDSRHFRDHDARGRARLGREAARRSDGLSAWSACPLNPIRHVDPIGTVIVPIGLALLTQRRDDVRLGEAGAGRVRQSARTRSAT